jgi:hypothetical protein
VNSTFVDRRQSHGRRNSGRRRRYPRLKLKFDGFYESDRRSLFANRGDLNLRGAFISTAMPDNPGEKAVVRLSLPGSVTLLRIPARVVWSNRIGDRGPLGMGVRFEAVEGWQLKRIAAALLRRGGFRVLPQLALAS